MKLHFLGTCAGTEPMPKRRHTSFAIETEKALYFFDAGEGASITAHLMGLDAMKTRAIFISHPHIDHIGGLPNLIWLRRKLGWMKKTEPMHEKIDVFLPDIKLWEGISFLLSYNDSPSPGEIGHPVTAGELYDDGELKVTAFGNRHMNNERISYSFRAECQGKSIVFSGDLKDYSELDAPIGEGCDAIIVETGHYSIDATYDYLSKKKTGRVFYCHNGREILNNPAEAEKKINEYYGEKACICEDGTTAEI